MPSSPDRDLSPQSVAVLRAYLESTAPVGTAVLPDVATLVKYVAGALPSDTADQTELAASSDLAIARQLAETWRSVEGLRQLTWQELHETQPTNGFESDVRQAWIDCVGFSPVPEPQIKFNLSSLGVLARQSAEGARSAWSMVSNLLESGLAPQTMAFAGANRSGASPTLTEGPTLEPLDIQLTAEISADRSLNVSIALASPAPNVNLDLWIAIELNRRWLGLGQATIEAGSNQATLRVDDFGILANLPVGSLPSRQFWIRAEGWPTVCRFGGFVLQAGAKPFADIESEPIIEGGRLKLNVLLDSDIRNDDANSILELWFGAGSQLWQLLGRWPMPTSDDRLMQLSCLSPILGPDGTPFPGVLKLSLGKSS